VDPALADLLRRVPGPPDRTVEAIIRLRHPAAEVPGVRIVTRLGRIATCRIPVDAVRRVHAHRDVLALKAARPVRPHEDDPADDPQFGAASGIRRPPGLDLTADGVVVGLTDWFLDVDHPAFRNPDGSTRVLALWDQRGVHRDSPHPYGYGRVHTRADIDAALRTDRPYDHLDYHPLDAAHGTHVADVAAGSGRAGGMGGLACAAGLAFVHLAGRGAGGAAKLGNSVRLLEAFGFIRDLAGGRPWVINASVGTMAGPHDGRSPVELAIDELLAATTGAFVVQSAGNYYRARTHATGWPAAGESRTLRFDVQPSDVTTNELEIWYDGRDELVVRIETPDGVSSGPVRLGAQADVVDGGIALGRIYHRAADSLNRANHLDAYLTPFGQAGRWSVTVTAVGSLHAPFHAWLERDDGHLGDQARFVPSDADPTCTTGTIANGRLPLVVGAYDARVPGRPLASFSSSGKTRDGRSMPHLVAPGVGVTAARAAPAGSDRSPGGEVSKSGTSMAAPHVTGAVALCLQAGGHRLDARRIRELVLGSAVAPPGSASDADRLRFGHGYLDVPALVAATRRALAKEPTMERDPDPAAPLLLAPARAYRELLYRGDGDIGRWIQRRFAVVARPGARPDHPVEAGDVVLQVALGRPGRGSATVVADPGSVLDRSGCLPIGRVLLRPRAGSSDDAEDAADAGAWTGSPEQREFRDRVLAAHIARSSRNGRVPPQRDLRRDELSCIPGTSETHDGRTTCVETLTETAEAAGRLLAAANGALAAAQAAGDEDALRTVRLTAVSGYRSSGRQRELWLGYFAAPRGYYERTHDARAALAEGPHSDRAVAYMLDAEHGFGLGGKIAAPGYSNHQGGIAVDLQQVRTQGYGIANKSTRAARAAWRASWLHRCWLRELAHEHGFVQLKTEEWHWEYRPRDAAARPAGSGPQESAAPVDHLGGRLWTFRAGVLGLPVAVFCPRAALHTAEVDVLLYGHGLLGGCRRPRRLPDGFVTDPPFGLGKVVDGAGKPVVLAVPLLDWDDPGGAAAFGARHRRWHALGLLGNLDRLVGEVLTEVGRVRATPAPALHDLVVAGHSRAYDLLEPLVHQRHEPGMSSGNLARLAQVWALDTTYAGNVDDWLDWLTTNPRLSVHLVYRPHSPTAAIGDAFRAKRGGRLTVLRADETHCAVPATRLPALLAGTGVDAAPAADATDAEEAGSAGNDLSAVRGLCPPGRS
jgi:subtilisin family serine protease/LAS superfamily LD-carboxypeptidase LdcB